MNKGDPRKVLRTRPQWKRGWRHYLRENANISALHMHFLFTSFMFFQDSELQFYLWMSNECYFTKSVQDSCGSEGRIGAPLIFRPAVQISLPPCICSYTEWKHANQVKSSLVISRSLCQKQDQCFGFPYQEHPSVKTNLGTGWFMNLKNGIIKSLRQGAPAIFYGIKPGLTVA